MFGDLFAPEHLLVILGIALVVFGPRRLPDLGRSLGEAIRDFKKGLREGPVPPSQPPPALETQSTPAPPPAEG